MLSMYPYGYFMPGISTAVQNTAANAFSYRAAGNNLQFSTEVRAEFYSLQGQLIRKAHDSVFTLALGAFIFKATDKAGNVVRGKIVVND